MSEHWYARARCDGRDDVQFFPGRPGEVWDVRPALALCAQCPVRAECLADGHDAGGRVGIWGGQVFGAPRDLTRLRSPTRLPGRSGIHGRNMYAKQHCRCDVCMDDNASYSRDYRERAKAARST